MRKAIEQRPRLSGQRLAAFNNLTTPERRILVVGDLHEPFSLPEYFDHCVDAYQRWNCTNVIFIGDLIDSHYASYHEADPDGYGAGYELELAIERLGKWTQTFPVADVVIGNHDRIVARKAFSGGIPKAWIKDYNEVLRAPSWTFGDRFEYDGVQYIHGEGGTARTKCRADMQSTVQGHLHTQLYTEYYTSNNGVVFGSQIGCGIDFDQYAFAYAKRGRRPALGCAIVIGGHTVINSTM